MHARQKSSFNAPNRLSQAALKEERGKLLIALCRRDFSFVQRRGGNYGRTMTQQQVLDQIVDERRRELYLEGHRLGDLRRYNLPVLPAAGTPFQAGGVYGTLTCFPLPDVERINNPNIGT